MTPLSPGFLDAWHGWFPGAPPIAHLVREAHPERWLRIHSLPESKRYADTEAEWAELLRRHNAVATGVLGDSARCAIVLWNALWGVCEGESLPGIGDLPRIGTVPAERMRDPVIELEPDPACLHGVEVTWRPGAHDAALRVVANDEARFLFVELEHGRVYAPYDGGADLFLLDSRERDEYRARYADWLSRYPSGL